MGLLVYIFFILRSGHVFYMFVPVFVEIKQEICLRSPKNPVFDGLSGFLQLGVVSETSNIANFGARAHTTPSQTQHRVVALLPAHRPTTPTPRQYSPSSASLRFATLRYASLRSPM